MEVGNLVSWRVWSSGTTFTKKYGIVVKVSDIRSYSKTSTMLTVRSNGGTLFEIDHRNVEVHGKFVHK